MMAGVSKIDKEMFFEKSPQFVLHDSQGFEGGETKNLQLVETFLKNRGEKVHISEQVHAVWCVASPFYDWFKLTLM